MYFWVENKFVSPKFSFIHIFYCEGPLFFKLSVTTKQNYCHNPNDNTTQPRHCSWVGHENDCQNNPTTTGTQW